MDNEEIDNGENEADPPSPLLPPRLKRERTAVCECAGGVIMVIAMMSMFHQNCAKPDESFQVVFDRPLLDQDSCEADSQVSAGPWEM